MVHMCIHIEFTVMAMNKQGSSAQCETGILECIQETTAPYLMPLAPSNKYKARSKYCTSVR